MPPSFGHFQSDDANNNDAEEVSAVESTLSDSVTTIARRRSSCPLPLPEYHITRTESEIQLCEDMAIAEMRDRLMFTRLVNGIRQRQDQQHFDTMGHSWKPSIADSGFFTGPPLTSHPPPTFIPRMETLSQEVSERTIENIISTYKASQLGNSELFMEDSSHYAVEDSQHDTEYSLSGPFTVTPPDTDRDHECYGQHAHIDHDDHHVFDMDL